MISSGIKTMLHPYGTTPKLRKALRHLYDIIPNLIKFVRYPCRTVSNDIEIMLYPYGIIPKLMNTFRYTYDSVSNSSDTSDTS